jgi:hypothetical protein
MWEGLVPGVCLMIFRYLLGGKHLFLGFPCIVCCGIALPPYKVLEFAPSAEEAMPHDGLNFELLLSVHHFWRWAAIVDPMLFRFVIGGQQRGVEYVMDGPGRRQA